MSSLAAIDCLAVAGNHVDFDVHKHKTGVDRAIAPKGSIRGSKKGVF